MYVYPSPSLTLTGNAQHGTIRAVPNFSQPRNLIVVDNLHPMEPWLLLYITHLTSPRKPKYQHTFFHA